MEKFYIVKEGSQLHNNYWKWKNSISDNNKIVNDFLLEMGLNQLSIGFQIIKSVLSQQKMTK